MSKAPIEFWFDFSSGYAYFAALEIDGIAARCGRRVLWRPFMLGTAFNITGARGLSSTPMKKDYAARDWARLARLRGATFRPPADHPRIALAATRAFYALDETDAELGARFAKAAFLAYYASELDTANAADVVRLARGLGADEAALAAAITDPRIKALAKARSEEAVARGVFGSPWIFADGEPFWGWDRLPMVESWLTGGGW
jgi:2-hydroxychromene-2-carboxylate isomerase